MAVVINGGKFEVLPNDLGRYRATRLWNEIVKFLHENVDVGKKRHLIWQYDDVFCGANAVDVIALFLEKNKNNFPNEITRCNAIKVCQTLMDQFIFVPATKSQSSLKFDTSPTALYRFVPSNVQIHRNIPKTQSKENIFLSPVKRFSESRIMKNTHFASRSPRPYSNPFSPVKTKIKERRSLDPGALINEPRSPLLASSKLNENSSSFSRTRGLRRRHSFIAAQKAEENAKAKANNFKPMDSGFANRGNIHRSLRMSLHKLKIKNVKSDPSNLCENLIDNEVTKRRDNVACIPVYSQLSTSPGVATEKVKEMAMSYMLTLVDISFLENMFCVFFTDLPEVKPSTTNDNPALNPAPENVVCNYPNGFHRNPSLDLMKIPWIAAAVACIGYIPDGLESLWSAQACKLKCYRAVATYHLSFLTSIFPENYLPVYFSIIECLKTSKVNTALKILTLVIILLPPRRQLQLEKLITFLKIVADDFFVNVDKRLDNRECVLRDFTSPILSHFLLGNQESGLLVDFLINKSTPIFNSVHMALSQNTTERLLSLWNTRFCFTKKLSELHQRHLTSRHLVALAMSVQNNSEINPKDKKQWMKKFLKVYPDLCS